MKNSPHPPADPALAHFQHLKPQATTRPRTYAKYRTLYPAINLAYFEKNMTAKSIAAEILKLPAWKDHSPSALYHAVTYHTRRESARRGLTS